MPTRSNEPRNLNAENIGYKTNKAGDLPTNSSVDEERPEEAMLYVNSEELVDLPRRSVFDRDLFPEDEADSSDPVLHEPMSIERLSNEEFGGISEYSVRQAAWRQGLGAGQDGVPERQESSRRGANPGERRGRKVRTPEKEIPRSTRKIPGRKKPGETND